MLNSTADPSKATIWGTAVSPATQTISLTGHNSHTDTIYAPHANITLSGSGDPSGAVIGKTVTVGGNGKFHYDTDLADVETSLEASYRLSSWSELNAPPGGGDAFARDNRAPFNALF